MVRKNVKTKRIDLSIFYQRRTCFGERHTTRVVIMHTTDKEEERLQELVVLFVLLLFFTRGILVSKMTNFLLSQHLFDDDVVELVPSLYA